MKVLIIRSLVEQKVQGQQKLFTLPAGSLLEVIRENPTGARAVDGYGTIWIIDKEEYEHVQEDQTVTKNNP